MERFEKEIEEVAREVVDLLIDKNFQYGDRNLLRYGVVGIFIRLHDKLARIEQQIPKADPDLMVVEESLKDIAGYALNALRLLKAGKLLMWGVLEREMGDKLKDLGSSS